MKDFKLKKGTIFTNGAGILFKVLEINGGNYRIENLNTGLKDWYASSTGRISQKFSHNASIAKALFSERKENGKEA